MPVGLRNNLRLSGYFALVGRHEAAQACLDTFVGSAPRTGGAANFPQSIMMVHIVSFGFLTTIYFNVCRRKDAAFEPNETIGRGP